MERVISHSLGMHNKSSLSNAANFFLNTLFIVVIKVIIRGWEYWVWLTNNLEWLQLTIFGDGDESPVVETTFPELAEVDGNLLLDVVLLDNVALLKFVPGQKVSVVASDWRWGAKTKEDL